jgi:hypothetical protein
MPSHNIIDNRTVELPPEIVEGTVSIIQEIRGSRTDAARR